MTSTKECRKCKLTFSATSEFFPVNSWMKDGLDRWCRICKRKVWKIKDRNMRKDTEKTRIRNIKRREYFRIKSKKRYRLLHPDSKERNEVLKNYIVDEVVKTSGIPFTSNNIRDLLNNSEMNFKISTITQTLLNLRREGFIVLLGRGKTSQVKNNRSGINVYKLTEKPIIKTPNMDNEILRYIETKNGIFTAPEINKSIGAKAWNIFKVIKSLEKERRIYLIGITGQHTYVYKLNPTKEEIDMAETLLEEFRKKMHFDPTAVHLIHLAIFEREWPNGIFSSVDLADLTGLTRSVVGGKLAEYVRQGYLEVVGISARSLRYYKIIKKMEEKQF